MIREYIVNISSEVIEDVFEEHPQELVRCKDCKYWKGGYLNYDVHPWVPCMELETKPEWFCAYGERR